VRQQRELIERFQAIDLNRLTPMQALELLHQWKQRWAPKD
jgi:hypothetical protein